MNIIIVFLFGALGGICRFELNEYLPKLGTFPLATLLINLVGCYLFTFLIKNFLSAKNMNQKLILGLGTGFIGAFTTFSSFILDSDHLLISGHYFQLFVYVFLSVFGGLLMATLGMMHGRRLGGNQHA
ncbi:fluoride efflux transporter FluC [Lactococcus termiticola]|uniref:Fluoride-specific ion channel FluC n=1 Tax=Lactococcus termiticola TaxID=2169526 RepID=A0A2R5HE90_9LACT|nr:CrcB family protein [Lactococcus termiticola]GBG96407.1 chromosome condensation protein CrcB [Lactococcus termiticola]